MKHIFWGKFRKANVLDRNIKIRVKEAFNRNVLYWAKLLLCSPAPNPWRQPQGLVRNTNRTLNRITSWISETSLPKSAHVFIPECST